MSTWFLLVSQLSIVAFALISGVFLAFSDFIMRALDTARPPSGIEVMQIINREVFKYVFMALFLGMAPVSLGILVYTYAYLAGPAAMLIMLAAGLYLVGVFGVTVACNVPLNNRLARMDHASDDALDFWKRTYLPNWTRWNNVRAFASVLAASLYMFALVDLAQG